MNRSLICLLSLCFFFSMSGCNSNKNNDLLKQIEQITESKQARVGIAIIGYKDKRELIEINGDYNYPMQSVYKFHLALAIMDMVDKGELQLNQKFFVPKSAFAQEIYSPLRDRYPNGDIDISLEELLNYIIIESDNIACDLLFDIAGGTEKVNQYIQTLDIEGINIAATEAEMHKDWDAQYLNYSTPAAAALLLEKFFSDNMLSYESREFLLNIMYAANTGENRIKALLPERSSAAHRTGTGPRKNGIASACNDIGIVTFAEGGTHFIIAVFITDSKESNETNELIIAEITKAACAFFGR